MESHRLNVERLLEAAIAARRLVEVHYNRGLSVVAPHSIIEKNGTKHLRAVTVERDGRRPRELKLGTFNFQGLSDVVVTRRIFSAKAIFEPITNREAAAP